MSDSKNQRQSVLMRSSLRLNEKEDLFGLITAGDARRASRQCNTAPHLSDYPQDEEDQNDLV